MCLQGGLRGDDPETTLTAFVLIALAEAKQAGIRCNDPDVNVEVIHTNILSAELVVSSSYTSSLVNCFVACKERMTGGIISSCT